MPADIVWHPSDAQIADSNLMRFMRADGRYVHDMYLMQVKTPAESKEPWDYVKVAATMPGDEVFITKAETRCPMWK